MNKAESMLKALNKNKSSIGTARKKVTIREVAQEAKVSIGTVSRVFNGFNVAPDIVKRVQAAATKFNYRPTKSSNHSMPGRNESFFSILVHDKVLTREIWTQQILFSIVKILGDYNYKSTLKFIPGDAVAIPDMVKNTAGCIIWGDFSEKFYQNLALGTNNIPIVSYSRTVPYTNSVSVLAHNKESMSIAVEYLLASGHQKIGLVLNSKKSEISGDRYKGFLKTMNLFKQEINPAWMFFKDEAALAPSDKKSGFAYDSTRKILSQKERPSCIIYGSDNLACEGLEAINDCGLSVPDDISILGFDDLLGSDKVSPPLTTMGLDTFAVAEMLVDSLEKLLKHRPVEKELYISRELIRRESVAVCK
jgi:LacI family transcriptional regulator, galactose operon repressor